MPLPTICITYICLRVIKYLKEQLKKELIYSKIHLKGTVYHDRENINTNAHDTFLLPLPSAQCLFFFFFPCNLEHQPMSSCYPLHLIIFNILNILNKINILSLECS